MRVAAWAEAVPVEVSVRAVEVMDLAAEAEAALAVQAATEALAVE